MSCSNAFILVNKIHAVRRKLVLRIRKVFGVFEFEVEAEKKKLKFIQSNISSVDNVLLKRKFSEDLEDLLRNTEIIWAQNANGTKWDPNSFLPIFLELYWYKNAQTNSRLQMEIGQVQMWKITLNPNEKSYCRWRAKGRNRQTKGEKIFCKTDWETNYLQDAIANYLVASFKNHSTQRSFEEGS